MITSSLDAADNGTTSLRVYFAKGPTLKDWANRVGWRWLLRHPLTTWEILGTEFIGLAWKSDARHVLVAQGGGVLDYQYCKVVYYAESLFRVQYPNIIGWFDITHDQRVDLSYTQGDRPRWWIGLVVSRNYYGMFLTAGMYRPRTCVTVAAAALAAAGIRVPKKCWSPPRLAWWLMEQGYAFIPAETAAQRRTTR